MTSSLWLATLTERLLLIGRLLSIDRRLVAIDGSNSEWQRNLLLSLERFGDVTLTVGDTVAAVAAYEQTISLHRRLAASGKTDTQWQKEVSASLEKISRLKRWAIYEGMLADDSQLAEADKTNAKQRGIAAKVAAMRASGPGGEPCHIATTGGVRSKQYELPIRHIDETRRHCQYEVAFR